MSQVFFLFFGRNAISVILVSHRIESSDVEVGSSYTSLGMAQSSRDVLQIDSWALAREENRLRNSRMAGQHLLKRSIHNSN